jgi:hypothetical protein
MSPQSSIHDEIQGARIPCPPKAPPGGRAGVGRMGAEGAAVLDGDREKST